jgi:signal transduction histidine kinase
MRRHLSARARLTLLYTSLFAVCGAVLLAVTYSLLAQQVQTSPPKSTGASEVAAMEQCIKHQSPKGGDAEAKARCAALYAKWVTAGAAAQRDTTLDQLLMYSALTLAAVTLLAAVAGWLVAGRILRPVHQLTAAARNASEANLSQRIALQGPHDELRALADTFDEMLERLDSAFAAQQHFIANASHELRTPLTVMRTSIDVVLAKPRPTVDELTSMAAEVRTAADHAEQLIDALLTLARNEQPLSHPHRLDLAVLVEDALDERHVANVATMSTLNEAPVLGDDILLERLIANLLDNAERYNIPGGRIEVSTVAADGICELRIVNTGPVIPAGDVQRLFEPFTRADDRTRHDGFGLGLALVRSIAKVHDGSVTASAVPTGGLDISVHLPRCRGCLIARPDRPNSGR